MPLLPTIVVAFAVAAMIALGLWQLNRVGEKNAQVALYRANQDRPPIAFPAMPPVPDAALFRRSSANCLQPASWRVEGGVARNGRSGFRQIADCRTGAEGPGLLVDMGVSFDPQAKPSWTGGPVEGVVTTEPGRQSFLARAFGPDAVVRPMLVATTPAPGLQPSAPPDPSGVPNNHFFYAMQWFFFAAAAAIIYALALRKRRIDLAS